MDPEQESTSPPVLSTDNDATRRAVLLGGLPAPTRGERPSETLATYSYDDDEVEVTYAAQWITVLENGLPQVLIDIFTSPFMLTEGGTGFADVDYASHMSLLLSALLNLLLKLRDDERLRE
ncbi:hypothetical protein EIP91_006260, partial [Steccherinum ochraceum]